MKLKGRVRYAWVGGVLPYMALFRSPYHEREITASGVSYAEARSVLVKRLEAQDFPPPDEEIEVELKED